MTDVLCDEVDAHIISERFDDVTVLRGLDYEQRDRVRQISVRDNGHEIVSLVAGSRGEPYSVLVKIEHLEPGAPPEMHGDCTCPMVIDCKHVVATLAAALYKRLALSPEAGRREPARRDPRIDRWFSDIDGALLSPGTGPDAVLYLLAPDRYSRRLAIGLATARRKTDGTFGTSKPYTLEAAVVGQARALTADDVQVASLLSTARRMGPRFNGMLVNAALDIALGTGRVFWTNAAQPLRRAPTRGAELVWMPQPDGTQRLGAFVDGAQVDVVCTDRPWGVSPARGEIAELEFGRDPRLLATLFDAPAVSEVDAPSVAGRLAPLGLPVPATSVEITVDASPPTMHLTLERTAKGRNYWDADPVDGALARVTFGYGDVRVPPGVGAAEWQTTTPAGITLRRRDPNIERSALAFLTARGLRPASYSYDSTVAPGRFVASQPSPRFWSSFLLNTVPTLEAAGWDVTIADDFPYRIVVSDAPWDMAASGVDAVTLDVALTLDGQRIPLIPLLAQALAHGKIPVRDGRAIVGPMPNGALVSLPAERLQRLVDVLVDVFDRPELMRDTVTIPLSRALALEGDDAQLRLTGEGAARVRDAAALLRPAGGRPVALPRTLRATLRPYQRDGFAWLQRLRAAGFGGILADSMGLGKTVQTIAHLLQERKTGRLTLPALIVAPTSLLPNWEAEVRRFGPSLRTLVLHGARRSERHGEIEEAHVVVTSYALLVRDFDLLGAREWSIVVLDEAQNIKNPSSKTAKAARLLRAEQRLCLTGTPIENHLEELWSLFAFVDPTVLGDRERFRRIFRTPIEKRGDDERRKALAGRIAPFVLRRTKEQVATDLPAKTEILTRVELGEAQRDLYETIRAAMHERVREALARRGLARSHIVVLDALLKLRQVCCHPRLLPSDRARGVHESAKLDALREMVEEMVDDGRRILLFSQFTSMLRLIEEQLQALAIPYVQLTGDTKDRATPVRRFQAGEVPVFLISLKAGGTGLNLTAADTVIHYDPWWNPAVENQATDRAHRIGQDKPVFVYKLVCEDTIEERILELQARKGAVAQALLDDTASTVPLDAAEIARLFE